MDKFDLNEMECKYDVISGTESAYVTSATNDGPVFRNDFSDCGCGCDCDESCDELMEERVNEAVEHYEKGKSERRKATPIYSGVLMYFPDAIKAVARCSQAGNDQHHPEKPLHWDRNKSTDELDALTRHLMEAGTMDDDGIRHSAKVAWRALANLQKELENAGEVQW